MLKLRPYQEAAEKAVFDWFGDGAEGAGLIVLPTGTGKSLSIASLIKECFSLWPQMRVMKLTHVKELIDQNYKELKKIWPEAPAGIYSAGLGRKDLKDRIVYAGIQSIHRKFKELERYGPINMVLIDEAHLIPRNSSTMYGKFFEKLKESNPNIIILGYTATPYRLDSGSLHKGKGAIFDRILYEYSVGDAIKDGYLSPVTCKRPETRIDLTGVKKRGGEFIAGDLNDATDQDHITKAAIAECLQHGEARKSWLFFCSSVEHAGHVQEELEKNGISCGIVTGDTPAGERAATIERFKRGQYRALANVNVLTTGFNAPGTDLIAMLRATESTGLYIQMVGRGTRLADGKDNCLVLDFAGNVERHGPIDAVYVKEKAKSGDIDQKPGEAPSKYCEQCAEIVHAAIRVCPMCGFEFPPPEPKIQKEATRAAILSTERNDPKWFNISSVSYKIHPPKEIGKPPTLAVEYWKGEPQINNPVLADMLGSVPPLGPKPDFREWICLEHTGWPRDKAVKWWKDRTSQPPPSTIMDALTMVKELKVPTMISATKRGKYWDIHGYSFLQAQDPGE